MKRHFIFCSKKEMVKTRLSTTTIVSPTDEISYGYEACPIAPPTVIGEIGDTLSWAIGVTCADGTRIYWDEETVSKHLADGTTISWFKAPTMTEALKHSTGAYFRFHQNGLIERTYGTDKHYYWSEEVDCLEEEGTVIWNHFNEDKQEYEEKEDPVPCTVCEKDCRGSYDEAWSFCTAKCQSYAQRNPQRGVALSVTFGLLGQ